MRTPRSNISVLLGVALVLVAVILALLGGLQPSAALEVSSSSRQGSWSGAVAFAGSVNPSPTPPADFSTPPPDQPQIALPDGYTPSYPNIRSVTDVASPTTWRVLLLVYRNTDVDYVEGGVTKHMTTSMSQAEIDKALAAFNQFGQMVPDYSANEATLNTTVVHVTQPVDSITAIGSAYWLSPADVDPELDTYASPGTYDSVEVLWQPCNNTSGACIPPFGWGVQTAASAWSNGATYASFMFGTSSWWNSPTIGQLYLWGWLGGVMNFYAGLGYHMPELNAEKYGYQYSETNGWETWYRDLMTGQVWDPAIGAYAGISPAAWRRGTITHGTATISGQVKNAVNQPIGGVTISIPSGRSVTTDPTTGRYVMDGLAAGTYTLTPSKPGYTFLPSQPTIVVTTDTTQDFIASAVPADCGGQWRAEYFDTVTPQGNPAIVRCDSAIDFYWGATRPKGMPTAFPESNFSVRWQRTLSVASSSLYRFRPFADDGIRLYIDGMIVFDGETSSDFREYVVDITLSSGDHEVVWQYTHETGESMVQVGWYVCANGARDCVVRERTQQRYQTEYPSVAMPTTCASAPNPAANQTIARYGCLITSYAMMLQSLGINTDPVELNEWVSTHNGYLGTCDGNLASLTVIEAFALDRYGVQLHTVLRPTEAAVKQIIRDRQLPVIYQINWSGGGSHFFLAADVARISGAETFGILDPHHAWACQAVAGNVAPYSRIQCAIGTLKHRIDLSSYASAFPYAYLELSSQARTPSLQFNATGAELLLTDAQGRRVGYERATGNVLYELPNSLYYDSQLVPPESEASGPPQRALFLSEGAGTTYTLQAMVPSASSGLATSTMASEFEISVISFDVQLNSAQTTITGSVSPGQAITFQVDIVPGQSIVLTREMKLYLPLLRRN